MKTQKTWFITGAARGFGFDITEAILNTGDNVVATVRSKPEELAAKLGNNSNLHVVTLDTTNEKQAVEATASGIAKFGKIDVLVNNAGYGLLSAAEEATSKEVFENFNVNVFGVLNVIRAVLPHMREKRSGHIINISSIGGLRASVGWGVYGATKFAIEGITESLAAELAPLGIHATVVAPGFFRTNFLDQSSLTRTKNVINDYSETVGKMREFATSANNHQPGDPKKLAAAFLKLAASDTPPVHLPLGKDTLDRFRAKTKDFENDINTWYDTITGTNHDNIEQ